MVILHLAFRNQGASLPPTMSITKYWNHSNNLLTSFRICLRDLLKYLETLLLSTPPLRQRGVIIIEFGVGDKRFGVYKKTDVY
jgi:hypothetical protein